MACPNAVLSGSRSSGDPVELVKVSVVRRPQWKTTGAAAPYVHTLQIGRNAIRGHGGAHRRQQLFGRRDQDNSTRARRVLWNEVSDRIGTRQFALITAWVESDVERRIEIFG